MGNAVAPQKISDTLGAEILRMWTGLTDYSGELSISDEILKRVVESYRRIRNTLRFLLANTADFDVVKDGLPIEEWLEIDRYALVLTDELQKKVLAHYEKFEFQPAMQAIQNFCSEDLGGFYLDILKDRLYVTVKDGKLRRSAQSALHHILLSLTKLIAPVLSFTAEEIWTVLHDDSGESVFLHSYHRLPELSETVNLKTRWDQIRVVRAECLKVIETARAESNVGSSLQAELTIGVAENVDPHGHKLWADFGLLFDLETDLRFVLITSSVTVEKHSTPDASRKITAAPSTHPKCARCWHYRADVGSNSKHPTLCGRCVDVVDHQKDEGRRYA